MISESIFFFFLFLNLIVLWFVALRLIVCLYAFSITFCGTECSSDHVGVE